MTYHDPMETTSIASCAQGDLVQIRGTVRSITLLPKGEAPRFEVAIEDDSGIMTLTWLGRRRIAGIEPGRDLTATGRMTCSGTRRRMFNPRYTLWPVNR
jgi:RecG-like helicase